MIDDLLKSTLSEFYKLYMDVATSIYNLNIRKF